MSLHADRATKLSELLLQFEDAIAAIDNEEFSVRLTLLILAVAEPIQSFVHLTIPGCLHHPVHFLNVSQQIESKIDANGYLALANRAFLFVLQHRMHRDDLVVSMRPTVLDQLFVDLVCASKICTIHALVSIILCSLWFLLLHVK